MFSSTWQCSRLESSDLGSGDPAERKEEPIEIYSGGSVNSVAFLADGKYIVSGENEGKIRRWRVNDGESVEEPMDAGSAVCTISASQDGRWVVSGLGNGWVSVWNLETDEQAIEFQGHTNRVSAVDVSPDATKIATGSIDNTAHVWSFSTGERLLGPLQHDFSVVAAKFSPDGRHVATATWERNSIRVYDAQNGDLLIDFPIKVASPLNGSLAWDGNNIRMYALSCDANIHCLDVQGGTVLSKWRISKRKYANCITLASNGQFIVASSELTVSFWDTGTLAQIGSVIEHDHALCSMAISAHDILAMGGGLMVTLRSLPDILPSHYFDTDTLHVCVEEGGFEDTSLEATSRMLERTVEELRSELAGSLRIANEDKDGLNEIIKSLRADLHTQETSSNRKIMNLERTVQELQKQLVDSQCIADEKEKRYKETIDSLNASVREQDERFSGRIVHFETVVQHLHTELTDSQQKADNLFQVIRVKSRCEILYAEGHVMDAAASLLEILDPLNKEVKVNEWIMDWLTEFAKSCITTLESVGDDALNSEKLDEAITAYAAALSLTPLNPDTILTKWTSAMLIHSSPRDAVCAGAKFKFPMFLSYRTVCDALEDGDRFTEAVECFKEMQSQLSEDAGAYDGRVRWELDFREHCAEKLVMLGDAATNSENHDVAIGYYSNALSLNPTNLTDILVKRSKSLALSSAWEEALSDADQIIELDPSSFKGYERKHAALHAMTHYTEAFSAFRTMLSKLEQSPDPHTRGLRHQYIDATPTIRKAIEQAIQPMPRVLINTTTGRLYNKAQQAAAFEELPIYDELRSSMITLLDCTRIRTAVKIFYRYVMLSHRWQFNEPTFQIVENISIYVLPASPAHIKLQSFCNLVQSLQFQWAWSDTCCIDQLDKGVLQESLVAMFKWYRGSSLTIVHLLGVLSESQQPGNLWQSIWNTRGWTYQEYVASLVVQFYTEDWQPYLGLEIFNHKDSQVILSEMERATHFATKELAALCPGLNRVREKLYLASRRHTTREEDIAYSLFGIFNVAIPVIYGEGDQAVGRLLEHVLTGSGDVTILAWTGHSGSYNSCLPIDLVVYSELVPPHVPQPMKLDEMDSAVAALRSTSADHSLLVMLYRRLHELPSPSIAASRLRLPGIVFSITELNDTLEPNLQTESHVYHARTLALGEIEIETRVDLSGMKDLILIHPWISSLLDQEFAQGTGRLGEITRALRFVVRLRQPFGALLLAPLSRVQYRRVATDRLIMVHVREEVPLTELTEGIRIVDVQ